ncbi:PAN2-PAN3 deadenylation complex subunit PAN3 [Favolaschia claudopus]|uniref:PAN2-PAN3 deadenylation complex subunit PAN3 n=1 Tax=Favolaschia claudopus TaxID=2862362 RepID=A0AAW0DVY5_9AGAR
MAFFTRPQSANAAIKIVRPSSGDDDQLRPSRKDSVQRQCRNIMIYGSCKFENKGCAYYHPPAPDAVSIAPRAESPSKGLSQSVNAPVFIPKVPAHIKTASTPPPSIATPPPPEPQYHHDNQQQQQQPEEYGEYPYPPVGDEEMEMHDINSNNFYADTPYDGYDPSTANPYFASATPFLRQPLNYHLYSSVIPSAFVNSITDTQFVPPSSELRTLLQSRGEDLHIAPAPGLNLPEELQGYHSLIPLENTNGASERRKFGNWTSTVYRAVNSIDGTVYCLRRIENYRLPHQAAFTAIETWAKLQHSGIISIHEAFTTHAFGDSSLVVAYAYHPKAQTLFDAHLKSAYGTRGAGGFQPIPERTLWSYIVQLAGTIKRVHDAGHVVRMIDVSKVLVTSKNRVRISSCGIFDVLLYDTPQDTHLLQQDDLTMFGRLLFALCTGNVMASSGGNFQKSLEVMGRLYSPEIKAVALFLVNKGGPHKSIGQLLEMISSKVAAEMGDALDAADTMENELMGELENARLVRLLCKFNFINERPEFAREPRWSETGDRYIVKLFRDYVFHQVDESGNPSVNLSHVLACLSKLDSGTDERIMLVSRDEQSCLVVSYKDIKACIESSFSELARAGSSTTAASGYR